MKAKIQLIRVDNRLVHGQVGMSWTNSLDVDTIVVVDDEVAYSPFPQKLMLTIAKAAGVQIRFYSVDKFMEVLDSNASSQKLFVVVKTISTVVLLANRGLANQKVNIGNVHYDKGRRALNKKVYLTKEDVDNLNYLTEQGFDVFYQDVPGTNIEKIRFLDFESLKR